ncbi:retinal-specific phospholipid-transporting ATPase ABCA4-like [Penaeus japonicus]|uniref:retinal-specific phospholipid-transporting ATPase ABCA4-like n=1 Tax=Penaeus japonicus TaxID=27405 RepID=UPI001C710BD4|nr:retinal-specific phospholipid-transporting ATPase ABCA4-like [Penaeus japonicus]
MKPRETIFFYHISHHRIFPSFPRPQNVDRAIKQLGLSNHEHSYIRYLSGGTMRKVSLAQALIGNPPLVLLDEPTTGMDPASRRIVWRAVQSVTQDGRTVLLTSHSMDEVNYLSHRMAIMVNGYLVCMGSPHYLKYKLGDKYTIRVKSKDIEDLPVIIDYLRGQFNEVLLKEQHHLSLVAEVSRRLPLRLIFETLNSAKLVGVTEYDVSQTTLNEVFRLLTSHQGDGQVPPSPTDVEADEASVPMHLPNLSPAGVNVPDSTFQSPRRSPFLSPEPDLTPDGRRSMYDNVEDGRVETYATVGRLSAKKAPTPEVAALDRDSPSSQASTADDSPEEEWTHL